MYGNVKGRSDLVLIVYDTARVIEYQERDAWQESRPWFVPAEYALILDSGSDWGILGQVVASTDEFMEKAVWFNCYRDLQTAVETLREQTNSEQIPDTPDCIIDFPFYRDKIMAKEDSLVVAERPSQETV